MATRSAPESPTPGHPLVDAHVHVWDTARLHYPWLADVPVLNSAFLPSDIDRADGATSRMVFVQAGCLPSQSVEEARWVAGLADAWPELSAIVAAADLRSGAALEHHLDALSALEPTSASAGRSALGPTDAVPMSGRAWRVRVAGIRHLLQDEPDDLLADTTVRAALLDGLRRVAERGLTFDVCVRHRQLDTVVDLLERIPELSTVLDHVGKPPVDDGIDSEAGRAWADAIDRLARLPLAHVKLSGLAAESSDTEALDAHAEEFLAHALRAFGPERSMVGSDWPVSARTGATGTLASWRHRVRSAAAAVRIDTAGIAAIESGTAERFYGLADR